MLALSAAVSSLFNMCLLVSICLFISMCLSQNENDISLPWMEVTNKSVTTLCLILDFCGWHWKPVFNCINTPKEMLFAGWQYKLKHHHQCFWMFFFTCKKPTPISNISQNNLYKRQWEISTLLTCPWVGHCVPNSSVSIYLWVIPDLSEAAFHHLEHAGIHNYCEMSKTLTQPFAHMESFVQTCSLPVRDILWALAFWLITAPGDGCGRNNSGLGYTTHNKGP